MPTKANTPAGPFVRVAGFAGLGFATLIVLANVIVVPTGLPPTGADTADAVAYFSANRAVVGLTSALTPAAWVLSTVFAAGAVAALWRSDRDRGAAWSLVGFAGVLLQNGAFAGVTALRLALVDDPTGVLWPLHDALFTLNGVFLALALLGLSLAGRHAGLIARWHAGLGLLSAALLFSSATLTPWIVRHAGPLGLLGLTGWLLWVAWIVAYSTALIRRATGE
ncbi:hypothetical protein FHX81_5442 [Saccharothrix saharensis]|uniref:DUF4386 family protein n=1 Tax=Saccharothrix saharensis TaxID=571190 RepID=A0A543JJJ8_9PSEU|nr:hypothetical protein [Saccharothrix saharensis]TQM83029.1 hypothetical protein FHX81_5442 [Saccharothrix saharensis]